MNVLVLDGLGRSTVLKATQVVVTTDSGTPVALAVELMPNLIENTNIDDEDFNIRLRMHGIDRTVQVGTIRPPRIGDFQLPV
jgi:hypothetical protein